MILLSPHPCRWRFPFLGTQIVLLSLAACRPADEPGPIDVVEPAAADGAGLGPCLLDTVGELDTLDDGLPSPDGTPRSQACHVAACDDDNKCTTDGCAVLGCLHLPVACQDDNACTSDTCDPADGCRHTGLAEGALCSAVRCVDGQLVAAAKCKGGACLEGDKVGCDDGDECTVDACSPDFGCSHMPKVAIRNVKAHTMVLATGDDATYVMVKVDWPPAKGSLAPPRFVRLDANGLPQGERVLDVQIPTGKVDVPVFAVRTESRFAIALSRSKATLPSTNGTIVVAFTDLLGNVEAQHDFDAAAVAATAMAPLPANRAIVCSTPTGAVPGSCTVLDAKAQIVWQAQKVDVGAVGAALNGDVLLAELGASLTRRHSSTGGVLQTVTLPHLELPQGLTVTDDGVTVIAGREFYPKNEGPQGGWLVAVGSDGKVRWSTELPSPGMPGGSAGASGMGISRISGDHVAVAVANGGYPPGGKHGAFFLFVVGRHGALIRSHELHFDYNPTQIVQILAGPRQWLIGSHRSDSSWLMRTDAWGNSSCALSGACVAKKFQDCPAWDPCVAAACDAQQGGCHPVFLPESATCSDAGSKCQGGKCLEKSP